MPVRTITLLALCQAVLMTGTSLLVATSALVGKNLGGDPGLATIPLGMQYLAMTLSTIPASFFMRRYGRRAGFLLGIALGLTGAAFAAWSVAQGEFLLFCIASLLLGAFNSTGQYYRFAAADVVDGSHRSRAISLVLAGGIVAGFFGPNLANWTRQLAAVEFEGSYLSLLALYLVGLTAAALLRIPAPSGSARHHSGRPLGEIVRQPAFIVAVLAATVSYGVMNMVMVATPLAMNAQGHPFADAAFVIQWHVVAMFVPSFFTGHLIRRFGVIPVMAGGVALLAGCVGLNCGESGVWQYWMALVFLGVGWNFLFIGATTLLTETYTEPEKAKCQAFNDFIVFGVVTLTALSSGTMLELVGWQVLNLSVTPLLALVSGSLLWLYAGREGLPASVAVTDDAAD